jgi:hypothetical protein
MRTAAITLCLVALVVVFGGTSAFGSPAASRLAGGSVYVHVTPGNGAGGTIVITGAIGDYGTTLNVNKYGKAADNGNFAKITLKMGSFLVDKTLLNVRQNKAKTVADLATCSFRSTASAPVTLSNGTGLYAGISGRVMITVTFGGVGAFYASGPHKGQCNQNRQPLAQFVSVSGPGTVKFS